MTQYTSEVEYIRQKTKAEVWGRSVNYLLAQDGFIETCYNSGLVTREYHRKFGKWKAGDFIEVSPAMPLSEQMLHAPR